MPLQLVTYFKEFRQ